MGTQLEECVMLGLGRPELVFTRYDGALADPGYFSKAFSRIAAGAGLRVTLHGLRHTHATQLLNDGIPIKVVSERLGHATAATTLNIYAHALPNQQEEAAVRVDASIRKALEG